MIGDAKNTWHLPNFRDKLRHMGTVVRPLVRLWPELISSASCQSQLL